MTASSLTRCVWVLTAILTSSAAGFTSQLQHGLPAPALRTDAGPGRAGVDAALECGLRALALDYARFLQPSADDSLVFDALRLGADCNASFRSTRVAAAAPPQPQPAAPGAATFYVDAVRGDDGAAGSEAAPFATVARGLAATRGVTPGGGALLLLREGTFQLNETLALDARDSGLTLAAFPGEAPLLSGGLPLTALAWQRLAPGPAGGMSGPFAGTSVVSNAPGLTPGGNITGEIAYGGSFAAVGGCAAACGATAACASYTWHDASVPAGWALQCYFRIDGTYAPTSPWPGHYSGAKVAGVAASVWRAPLPAGTPRFDNLFSAATGRRLTRAKSPNGNPETTIDGFVGGALAWAPPRAHPPPQDIHVASPARADDPFFPAYQLGVGGSCAQFEPPSGFWCSSAPPAGSTYSVPAGVTLPPGLLGANFSGIVPGQTIFHAFHGDRWADWKFAVEAADAASGEVSWSYGGFQDARGWQAGDTFMMEGMLSFLDYYDEWFLDEAAQPMQLYLMVNDTAPAPSGAAGAYLATRLDALLRVNGSSAAPAVGITLRGLQLRHTAPTFMKPYASASGGDWSLRVDAALVLRGSEGAEVSGCAFEGIGGNALLLLGYNRGARIAGNSFRFVGDSAIVSLGEVAGIDGRGQDVPAGTTVTGNQASELGIYTKQSGFYYHAQSAAATITRNVLFNMPRAGININDGYAGGHVIDQNLCFNAVRETSDHGCLNSWDRQPYQFDPARPDDLYPAPTTISRNFFISNYHSTWPIDHDDGSNAYFDENNLLLWGGYKNYLGFDKHAMTNLYIYPDASEPTLAGGVGGQRRLKTGFSPYCYGSAGSAVLPAAMRDSSVNCTCIAAAPSALYSLDCDPAHLNNGYVPVLQNNTYILDSGEYTFPCGGQHWNLSTAQANGVDLGTVQLPAMGTAALLQLAASFMQTQLVA